MLKKLVFSLVLLASGVAGQAAKNFPPPPSNYVYDETGVLKSSGDSLSALLMHEDRQYGNQILVAVFKSLNGEDPVDYSNRLFSTWKPGTKGKDNGVLLAFFMEEKKIRIEVGYGLEPLLTDAKSKRIIIDIIGPAFRERRFGDGIIEACREIQRIIHGESEGPTPSKRSAQRLPAPFAFLSFIVLMIVLSRILKATGQTLHGSRHGWSGSSGSSWGGGGGFSGGGGGFSGGGGSSGGGGASGGW